MQRFGIYKINEVLPFVFHRNATNAKKHKKSRKRYGGHVVHMYLMPLRVFRKKGVRCIKCGIVGRYMALELMPDTYKPHFRMYAINGLNEEVLMTIDHKIPSSCGGKTTLKNLQTMCVRCNGLKADTDNNTFLYGEERILQNV
jgi:hypothetical protein